MLKCHMKSALIVISSLQKARLEGKYTEGWSFDGADVIFENWVFLTTETRPE